VRQKYCVRTGIHRAVTEFCIYDTQDSSDAIKEAMEKLDISTKKYNPMAILSTISGAKNELISATEYTAVCQGPVQDTVSKIYLEYQKILKNNEAVGF